VDSTVNSSIHEQQRAAHVQSTTDFLLSLRPAYHLAAVYPNELLPENIRPFSPMLKSFPNESFFLFRLDLFSDGVALSDAVVFRSA